MIWLFLWVEKSGYKCIVIWLMQSTLTEVQNTQHTQYADGGTDDFSSIDFFFEDEPAQE